MISRGKFLQDFTFREGGQYWLDYSCFSSRISGFGKMLKLLICKVEKCFLNPSSSQTFISTFSFRSFMRIYFPLTWSCLSSAIKVDACVGGAARQALSTESQGYWRCISTHALLPCSHKGRGFKYPFFTSIQARCHTHLSWRLERLTNN